MENVTINSITLYGLDVQKKISEISHILMGILEKNATKEVGAIVDKTIFGLKDIAEDPLTEGAAPWADASKHREFINDYNDMMREVETMEESLDDYRIKMLMDQHVIGQIQILNGDCITSLDNMIYELSSTINVYKLQNGEGSGTPVADDLSDHMERRRDELRLSSEIAKQQVAQIKLLQDSYATLSSSIHSVLYSAIPLWKDKMVSIMHSKTTDEQSLEEFKMATELLMSGLSVK